MNWHSSSTCAASSSLGSPSARSFANGSGGASGTFITSVSPQPLASPSHSSTGAIDRALSIASKPGAPRRATRKVPEPGDLELSSAATPQARARPGAPRPLLSVAGSGGRGDNHSRHLGPFYRHSAVRDRGAPGDSLLNRL